ncbi:hypothetical protein HK100_007800 [Physocladia obscura]|uniref:SH3 domain-containing protein n=1 Tax=Physocladia obscura TaxID=109957 RepID=A0AAD5T779_9FUNG|nr:hypothetical protein HK100_007800 [Physocladia obscura]
MVWTAVAVAVAVAVVSGLGGGVAGQVFGLTTTGSDGSATTVSTATTTTTTQTGSTGSATGTQTATGSGNGTTGATGLTGTGSTRTQRRTTTGATATADAGTTTATTAAASPTCISIAASALCPAYGAYYIDAASVINYRTSALTGPGSVLDFDALVDAWANAAPSSILAAAQCQTLDLSHVRYSDQFYCDWFLQTVVTGDAAVNGPNDCNAIMNGGSRPVDLPRIANETCLDYLDTITTYLNNATLCSNSVASGVQSAITYIQDACGWSNDAIAVGAIPVNMASDNSTEHYNCGFGVFQGNTTNQIESAFLMCESKPEACCTYDPTLANALAVGHIPQVKQTPPYYCQMTMASSIVSCGQLSGTVIGVILGLASLGIMYWGIQKQDKEAMKLTKSGMSAEWFDLKSVKNLASSFSGSTSSRTAAASGTAAGSSSNGVSSSSFSSTLSKKLPSISNVGSDGMMPQPVTKDRKQFQRFDDDPNHTDLDYQAATTSATLRKQQQQQLHYQLQQHQVPAYPPQLVHTTANTNAGPGLDYARNNPPSSAAHRRGSDGREVRLNLPSHGSSRANSKSPHRQGIPKLDDATVNQHSPPLGGGVDPFAEMMGGGGGSSGIPAYSALFEFRGQPGTMELDVVRAGDRVVILEVMQNGYAAARNLETGRQGLVPMNLLTR